MIPIPKNIKLKNTIRQSAGKKCAIPAVRFYRGFYSSTVIMGERRQVTPTKHTAVTLATMILGRNKITTR